MKKFWEDYKALCDHTGEFYAEHWKGIVILNVALVGLGVAAAYVADRKHQKDLDEFYDKYCDYGDEEGSA